MTERQQLSNIFYVAKCQKNIFCFFQLKMLRILHIKTGKVAFVVNVLVVFIEFRIDINYFKKFSDIFYRKVVLFAIFDLIFLLFHQKSIKPCTIKL